MCVCVCLCLGFRVEGLGFDVFELNVCYCFVVCQRDLLRAYIAKVILFARVCVCVGAVCECCVWLRFRISGLTCLGYGTSDHLVLDLRFLDEEGSWLLISEVRLHGSHMDRTARTGLRPTPLKPSIECAV